ncbi:MAG TPA: JAB domain-containing protein [Opitutaceae bacterium]|nr:JAB domain-containing protein [Opitutaceae bacterium]
MRVFEAKLVYEPTLFEVGAKCLTQPELVYDYMKDVLDLHPMQEVFYVIFLNQKNRPLGRIAVTSGTVSSTLVHPREVFRPAILAGASAVICAHNHPSGDPAPSSADLQATRKLREAAQTVDIALLDHVIIGRPECDPCGVGFYSFRSAGLL